MNTAQFSTEFDILFNSVTSNQGPGFSGYEKSVFLTKAEIQTVQERLSRKLDTADEGLDGSPRRQVDFSSITEVGTLESITDSTITKFDPRAFVYAMPSNVLFPLNEQLTYQSNNQTVFVTTVPLSYEEYDRIMKAPYKLPLKDQAWRLITQKHTFTNSETITYTQQNGNFEIYGNRGVDFVLQFSCSSYEDNTNNVKIVIGLNLTDDVVNRYQDDGYTVINCNDSTTVTILVAEILATKLPNINVNSVSEELKNAKIAELFSTGVIFTAFVNGSLETITPAITVEKQLLEIIGNFNSAPTYRMRYIRVPKPIIVEDLTDYDVNINGLTEITECELPEEMHHEILERAVTLAKIAWQGVTMTQAALASQSKQ